MPRKPKKYADQQRTKINPEWVEWEEENFIAAARSLGGGTLSMYAPELDGKEIPEQGVWIMVLMEPETEMKRRFRVPVLSIWRARAHTMSTGHLHGRSAKQAVIRTPGGDLHLWGYEYVVIPDATVYVGQEPHVVMHSLGGQPVLDQDKMFYLMSRGIARQDAALLLLNEVEDQDVFWFEVSKECAEFFRGPIETQIAMDTAGNAFWPAW